MSDDEKMFLYARANLIPVESNLHKYSLVIISQIINMIELDNLLHCKTFESVMSNLRNMWMEGIRELENSHIHYTNNDENINEMDGVDVIDLCSVLVRVKTVPFLSEKKAQSKKVRTNRNTTQWTKWKWNLRP